VVKAVEASKDRFGIAPILRVLGVAASTYYDWLAQERDPSPQRRADAELLAEIREIHDRSGATYGARGSTPRCAGVDGGCHASGSSG
jgi:putative transposase